MRRSGRPAFAAPVRYPRVAVATAYRRTTAGWAASFLWGALLRSVRPPGGFFFQACNGRGALGRPYTFEQILAFTNMWNEVFDLLLTESDL